MTICGPYHTFPFATMHLYHVFSVFLSKDGMEIWDYDHERTKLERIYLYNSKPSALPLTYPNIITIKANSISEAVEKFKKYRTIS